MGKESIQKTEGGVIGVMSHYEFRGGEGEYLEDGGGVYGVMSHYEFRGWEAEYPEDGLGDCDGEDAGEAKLGHLVERPPILILCRLLLRRHPHGGEAEVGGAERGAGAARGEVGAAARRERRRGLEAEGSPWGRTQTKLGRPSPRRGRRRHRQDQAEGMHGRQSKC